MRPTTIGYGNTNKVLRYHTSATLLGGNVGMPVSIQTANFTEATKYIASFGLLEGDPNSDRIYKSNLNLLKGYKVSTGKMVGRDNYEATWTSCTGKSWLLRSTAVRQGTYQFVVQDVNTGIVTKFFTQEDVVSAIRTSQATLAKHLKAYPRQPINDYLVQYMTFSVDWQIVHDTTPPKGKRRKNFVIKDKLDTLIIDIERGLPMTDVVNRLKVIVAE